MSTVYLIQHQYKANAAGDLVPKFNTASAERYGRLVPLLSPTAGPFNPESVIAELSRKLSAFTSDDYLLLLGNPCLIGWATAIAASYCPKLRMLQWSSRSKEYVVVEADLSEALGYENPDDTGLPESIQEALNSGDGTYQP
jgi:hypothetical protein